MSWLTLLGVCGLLIWKTEAFPDGAGDSACVTMQPGHYGTNASETPPEYVIKVSASTYCPGGSLQGTTCISLFVGLLPVFLPENLEEIEKIKKVFLISITVYWQRSF